MMSQDRAPLFEKLCAYLAEKKFPFHTPGHKQGAGADFLLKKFLTEDGLRADVSLMDGEDLDDLHLPTNCIFDAQNLAAELYGAKKSFFMVNGTTGAIHAMMLANLSPREKILLPRNVHRSVLGGLILTGAAPIFLEPNFDERFKIFHDVSFEKIRNAIEKNPDAKVLLLTSPTYYGVASDLEKIISYAHEKNFVVLIDEAHGAHLRFAEKILPPDALSCGADFVAQSTHKLLPSLTQTSLLHIGHRVKNLQPIAQAVSLLTTTSPNYLLMVSLDIARRQMALEGKEKILRAVELANDLRKKINELRGLHSFDAQEIGKKNFDVTKVTVDFSRLNISGWQAAKILKEKYKIVCELADAHQVLFLITMADTRESAQKLYEALKDFVKDLPLKKNSEQEISKQNALQNFFDLQQAMTPRDAFFKNFQAKKINLSDAVGKISAEEVTIYPPGIPLIYPGEIFSQALVDYLFEMKKNRAYFVGMEDKNLNSIKIFET